MESERATPNRSARKEQNAGDQKSNSGTQLVTEKKKKILVLTQLMPILAVVDELRLHTANATDPYWFKEGNKSKHMALDGI